jgi:hypothetical protein
MKTDEACVARLLGGPFYCLASDGRYSKEFNDQIHMIIRFISWLRSLWHSRKAFHYRATVNGSGGADKQTAQHQ